MKIEHDLYHWPTSDAVTATKTGPWVLLEDAMAQTGHSWDSWHEHSDGGRWLLNGHAGPGLPDSPWCIVARQAPETDADRIELAIGIAVKYSWIDGDHHKAWCFDQMVRLLAGDRYEQVVADAAGWDEGIAP